MFFPQGESGNVAVGIVLKMCITLLNENRIPNTVEKFTLIGKSKICYVMCYTLGQICKIPVKFCAECGVLVMKENENYPGMPKIPRAKEWGSGPRSGSGRIILARKFPSSIVSGLTTV